MAMGSIYRRKQDAILGTDNSSFISGTDNLARTVARYRGDRDDRMNEVDNNAVSRMEISRDYARSLYEHNSKLDHDYDDVSDLEDSDEEDERSRPRIPTKANQLLGLDRDSPYRRQGGDGNPAGVSSKAQKILGMSKALKVVHTPSPSRQQTLQSISSDTDNIAPKALRTLGIDTNAQTKNTDKPSPQSAAPFDPDDFKKLFSSSQYRQNVDNSSSTDVSSSLSRESTISWRTETPRSSQEVYLEDVRWRNRPSVFTKRSDSLVDPSAVLTEPFSPLSVVDKPWNQASPDADNASIYELMADLPPPPEYSSEMSNFVAELPADTKHVYEMPAPMPEYVELPAEAVKTASDKKNPGIQHPQHTAEQQFNSPPKSLPTEAAGGSSPSKISRIQQRSMTSPLTRAVSVPRAQLNELSRISTGVATEMARRPTVVDKAPRQDRVDRGRDYSQTHRELQKSRSAESWDLSRSELVTPISPLSANTGLGKIAAKAASGRQRSGSASEEPRTVAKSKYNHKTQSRRRDQSKASTASIKEEEEHERGDKDSTPKVESMIRKQRSDEEFPESPVTGYIAGHPAINKPLPDVTQEKLVLDFMAALEGASTTESNTNTVKNLRRQGLI